jgi:hypothetical protein
LNNFGLAKKNGSHAKKPSIIYLKLGKNETNSVQNMIEKKLAEKRALLNNLVDSSAKKKIKK